MHFPRQWNNECKLWWSFYGTFSDETWFIELGTFHVSKLITVNWFSDLM